MRPVADGDTSSTGPASSCSPGGARSARRVRLGVLLGVVALLSTACNGTRGPLDDPAGVAEVADDAGTPGPEQGSDVSRQDADGSPGVAAPLAAEDDDPVAGLEGSWRDLAQEDGSFHPDDWAVAVAACVRERGFGARADGEARAVFYDPVDAAQQREAARAIGHCEGRVRMDPRFEEPLDERQLRLTYDHFLQETIPCLEREGFEAGWDVPSFETFVARWPTAEQWNPWLQIPNVQQAEQAQWICPGIPFDDLWE